MTVSDSGLILWTPLEGVLTSGIVTVVVFDGELEDSEQFAVTVTQVNDSPLIASIAPSEVYLGDAYTYSVNVDDPDDTEFTFELDNALPGMTISDDGLITWIPESVGDYGPVTVSVFDGGEDGSLPGTELFTISVVYNYTVIDFLLYLKEIIL